MKRLLFMSFALITGVISAQVGINTDTPTETLDVATQGVRVRNISTAPYFGNAATDRVVMADANGVLKTVAPSEIQGGGGPGSGGFVVGETRSFSVKGVAIAAFDLNGTTKIKMNGKDVTNTSNTTRKLLIEEAGLTNSSPGVLIIEGLRLDFVSRGTGAIAPVMVNTTAAPIVYNISSLSTNDAYFNGIRATLPANALSYRVDGDDNFSMGNNDTGEYVNSQLTFPNGTWYNITFHATQVNNLVNGYWTAQRLQ